MGSSNNSFLEFWRKTSMGIGIACALILVFGSAIDKNPLATLLFAVVIFVGSNLVFAVVWLFTRPTPRPKVNVTNNYSVNDDTKPRR